MDKRQGKRVKTIPLTAMLRLHVAIFQFNFTQIKKKTEGKKTSTLTNTI